MPGIVGLIRRDGLSVSIAESIIKLMHFPTYISKEIKVADGISLGQVLRHESAKQEEWYFDKTIQAGILVNGAVMLSTPSPHRVAADQILRSYVEHGFSGWSDYDGAFIVAIVDLRKRKLFVCNDRLGELPLYYSRTEEAFCFGPEAKAVFTGLKTRPQFSRAGLVSFLAAGYCLGETTLFEDMKFLEPSTLLSLDLDTFVLEKKRLWNLTYDPDPLLSSRKYARKTLYEAIVEAHKLMLCDNPRHYDLLLSGGLDSRGILGVLDQLGRPPKRAFGYGLRDDLPHSDAKGARTLAEEFDVPFQFAPYNTDTFPQNASKWCYLSELSNDNFGWCAEGSDVLLDLYDVTADFSFIGDECWGAHGYVDNEYDARAIVLPPSLPLAMRAMLKSDLVEDCEGIYDQQISNTVRDCDAKDWIAYKDYLYLYGRVARFIFSLGYYKEFATELRRPFLANGVLDVIRCLPADHRVHKNLYVSALRHHLPRTMLQPDKSVDSLPDWQYDMRTNPQLREYFLELCDFQRFEGGPLGELLEPEGFKKVRDSFFNADARPISRNFSLVDRIKSVLSPLTSRSHMYDELFRSVHNYHATSSFGEFHMLRRVALLVLLQEQLSKFTSSNSE